MSTRVLLVESLLIVGLAVIGIFEGLRLTRVDLHQSELLGPGWYIVFLSAVLLICGVPSMYRWYKEFRRTHKSLSEDVQGVEGISLWNSARLVVNGILALFAYIVILPIVGYLVSTILFLGTSLRIYGEKSWLRCIAIAILLGLALYYGFVVLAEVAMP